MKNEHTKKEENLSKESRDKYSEPQSDVYGNTEYVDKESGVAIPSSDAVEDAKDWVDDENKK